MGDTPKFKITYDHQTVTLLRQITDITGPPKVSGKNKYYMVIIDNQGEENILFLSVPEKNALLEAGVGDGDSFTIYRKGSGEYDNQGRQITNTVVEKAGSAGPPDSNPIPAPARVPAPPSVGYGWTTSSFDNKLTPDLSVTPFKVDTDQERIFRRVCNGVGDELANVARQKALLMAGLDPDIKLTAAQAVTMSETIQSTFATLLIAWKELGYPVTPAERARIEVAENEDF